jgi:hypothetical protein
MRLNEWRKTAPNKEAMSSRVLAVLRPVLVDLGADADAECWVAWGEDADQRYSILAPTVAGLITVNVRPSDPAGPRATAKLVRWTKLSVTELGIEASGGHRLVGVQVESLVLKGMDEEADRICEFVRELIAGIDGRNSSPVPIVVQAATARGAIVALPTRASEDGETAPAPAKAANRNAAERKAAPAPKPAGGGSAKVVPIGSKAALRPASKPAASGPGQAAIPAPAAHDAPPAPPTPIAARAAAAQQGEQPGAAPAASKPEPVKPVPEADQPEWVDPHPIEEKVKQRPKPRPWAP